MLAHHFAELVSAAPLTPWQPQTLAGIAVAYLGPNTVLPLASALAAAIGVILMFWRYIASVLKRTLQFLIRRNQGSSPHATASREEPRA